MEEALRAHVARSAVLVALAVAQWGVCFVEIAYLGGFYLLLYWLAGCGGATDFDNVSFW